MPFSKCHCYPWMDVKGRLFWVVSSPLAAGFISGELYLFLDKLYILFIVCVFICLVICPVSCRRMGRGVSNPERVEKADSFPTTGLLGYPVIYKLSLCSLHWVFDVCWGKETSVETKLIHSTGTIPERFNGYLASDNLRVEYSIINFTFVVAQTIVLMTLCVSILFVWEWMTDFSILLLLWSHNLFFFL